MYGSGDVAEIAYLSLQEGGLRLVAVVDGQGDRGRNLAAVSESEPKARKFFGYPVLGVGELGEVSYHRVIVASTGPREEAEAELKQAGVEAEKVSWLEEKV